MIILIAGASHAGKTLLAQRILEEIISHGTDIEDRLDNSGCTRNSLKEDNRNCAKSFAESGERVTMICSDFEKEMNVLLREFKERHESSANGFSQSFLEQKSNHHSSASRTKSW